LIARLTSFRQRHRCRYRIFYAQALNLDEAAGVIDEGRRANQEAAAAKIFASEMGTKAGLDAIQILGGYGYIREFPVERFMRDAKLLEIGGGTSEILRSIIVKEFQRKL
jgi:isovaleryl-CoA dehydrogenase